MVNNDLCKTVMDVFSYSYIAHTFLSNEVFEDEMLEL